MFVYLTNKGKENLSNGARTTHINFFLETSKSFCLLQRTLLLLHPLNKNVKHLCLQLSYVYQLHKGVVFIKFYFQWPRIYRLKKNLNKMRDPFFSKKTLIDIRG